MLKQTIRYHFKKYKRVIFAKKLFLKRWFSNGGAFSGTIYFHPEQPYFSSVIYLMYHQLGLKRSQNQSSADVLLHWEVDTYVSIEPIGALNEQVTDISKSHVEFIFSKIFGYGSFVSQVQKGEKVVQKSEENALHDGKILDRIPDTDLQEDSYCYQKLIFNQPDLDHVEDLRVPVIDSIIPFVYRKIRPIASRFENNNKKVTLHAPETIFTPRELQLIIRFVDDFKLNYGELDILRDYISGRIYIIDVNKTPWGPPNGLSKTESKIALTKLSDLFYTRFFKKTTCKLIHI